MNQVIMNLVEKIKTSQEQEEEQNQIIIHMSDRINELEEQEQAYMEEIN